MCHTQIGCIYIYGYDLRRQEDGVIGHIYQYVSPIVRERCSVECMYGGERGEKKCFCPQFCLQLLEQFIFKKNI